MPIPKRLKSERRKIFVSRCMANKNMRKYKQKQRIAICLKESRR